MLPRRKRHRIQAELDFVSTAHQEIIKQQENNNKLVNRQARKNNQQETLYRKLKKDVKSIFLSATPAEYELELSDKVVEQIIRPTGLLDPITYVYPKSWDYNILLDSLPKLTQKKEYLNQYLKEKKQGEKINLEDIFWDENIKN